MADLRVLVVDDEQLAREELCFLLGQAGGIDIAGQAKDGVEALRLSGELKPDVVFLDVQMPGLTGFEVARRLLLVDAPPQLVFVTAFDQYAIDAFSVNAVDYVLKPVTDERLARCVERLKKKLADAEKPPALEEMLSRLAHALPAAGTGKLRWIRASKGEIVQQIAVDDVLYFQASDKYTCVLTREGESLIRMPLAELAGQLDPDVFWQIHRGTVVNMNAVASTRRDLGGRVFVKLKSGDAELPVSRAYAQKFKQM